MFMISSRDFTCSSCSMVTVVVTGHSSRRSTSPRWTPTEDGLQRGQLCWPPAGSQMAATGQDLMAADKPRVAAHRGPLTRNFDEPFDVLLRLNSTFLPDDFAWFPVARGTTTADPASDLSSRRFQARRSFPGQRAIRPKTRSARAPAPPQAPSRFALLVGTRATLPPRPRCLDVSLGPQADLEALL